MVAPPIPNRQKTTAGWAAKAVAVVTRTNLGLHDMLQGSPSDLLPHMLHADILRAVCIEPADRKEVVDVLTERHATRERTPEIAALCKFLSGRFLGRTS